MTLTIENLRAAIEDNPRIRKLTKRHYHDAVDRWIAFASEHPSNWTTRRAQAFYNGLLEGGMKSQSANALLYGLRYAFRRVAELDRDPDGDIMRVVILQRNGEAEGARVLTEAEARRLCDARRPDPKHPLDGHRARDFAVVVLGLQTGMRRMSLAGIRLDGVERSMIRGVPIKGGKKFDVPLSATAHAAIEPYLRWLRHHAVASGLFLRSIRPDLSPGPAISIRGVDELVRRVAKDAKVKDISPHSFRHTFVTWAREVGVQPFEIAAVTGHVSEESVGGRAGVIQDSYTSRSRSGARAADAIAKDWMLP